MATGTSGATLRLFVAASALLAGVSAYRGFLKLFTRLNAYDDTGYMLSLIQSFNQSGGLYRDVFSQYGPFYSEFYFILDRLLGISITHDGIRWVVLSFWVGSSIAAGIVAWQFRRSAWTAILVQMLAFQTLEVLWADPGHPLSLAVACLAGLTVCLSGIGVGKINWWRPIIAGALIGMLLLIKINLGLFALASVGTAAVFCCPVDRAGRLLRWAVGIVFCVLAGAVIGPVWPPFVRVEFITVFACTLIAVLVSTGGALFDWAAASRFCVRASAGLLTICVLAVSGVLLTGTGWADLIAGVIVRPMNLPQLFSVPPSFGSFSAAIAAISVLAAVGLRFLRSRSSTMDRHIGFALRLVFVGAVFAWVTGSCRYWLPFSLLWIAALPPTGESSSVAAGTARFGRGSVVLLAVGQLLGLYPVNGGQQVIPFFFSPSRSRRSWAVWLPSRQACVHQSPAAGSGPRSFSGYTRSLRWRS